MAEDVQLVPTLGLLTAVAHDDDVLEGVISLVVVESKHVGPPLSFDVFSGFVSHSDDVLITTKKCYFVDLIIMVLSTFE